MEGKYTSAIPVTESQHRSQHLQKERKVGIVDKAKNTAEDALGKAKEAAGDAVGNDSLKHEGQKEQSKSEMKDAGENVKDAGHNVKDAVTGD